MHKFVLFSILISDTNHVITVFPATLPTIPYTLAGNVINYILLLFHSLWYAVH